VKQAVFEQRCQREQVHANDDCYPSGDHLGPSNSDKHSSAEPCERELDANDVPKTRLVCASSAVGSDHRRQVRSVPAAQTTSDTIEPTTKAQRQA
jgi:hypothetical protein